MRMPLIALLLIVVSCSSTKPTPYQHEKHKEGFKDETFEELKVSRFKANSYTDISRAERYAEFRAIETCLESEKKHANILDIVDETVKKQVTRTTGTSWGPSYGYGMYPYYSPYSSFGFGVGMSTVSGSSWNETLVYPVMEIFYNCREKIYRPQVYLKEISAEQMKLLVKDLKGAMQIEKIADNSPNKNIVELGDIILKANGKRVEKVHEIIRLFEDKNSTVTLSILREGKAVTAKLHSIEVTDEVDRTEKEIIRKVCKDKKKEEQKLLKTISLCQ